MDLINQLNATTEYYWFQRTKEFAEQNEELMKRLNLKKGTAITRDNMVDGGKMVKIPLEYANSHRMDLIQ